MTLGWEDLPLSVSIDGAPDSERLVEQVPGVLVACDGGWVLLDTGFNPALIRDPALRRRFHPERIAPILPPGDGDPLENALEEHGLGLEDIHAVALSHLHNDHAGGVRHFSGRVPVHLQHRELDFALVGHPVPSHHGMFRIDFDDPGIDWCLAEGDVEIAPGLTALLTAGHTPGHQSFVIDFDESVGGGGVVLAFDAADLRRNIDEEISIGGRADATAEEAVEQIRRLKSVAAARHYDVMPGHDPVAWPAFTTRMEKRFGTDAAGVDHRHRAAHRDGP
ncbi:MAG TPA: N-acyl homoserine lactonase family protein [Acidimicrobiales bacterium]